MTCIVAVATPPDVAVPAVHLGADSAYSHHPGIAVGLDGKLLRVRDDVVIGIAGEGGGMSALRRRLADWPALPEGADTEEYVNLALVPRIADILREAGRTVNDRGTERCEVEMLVAVRGDIYHVTPSFAVFRPELHYMAIGTGAPYALGVLYASCSWSDTQARMLRALSAAVRFCPSVRPPYAFMCTAAVEVEAGEGAVTQ